MGCAASTSTAVHPEPATAPYKCSGTVCPRPGIVIPRVPLPVSDVVAVKTLRSHSTSTASARGSKKPASLLISQILQVSWIANTNQSQAIYTWKKIVKAAHLKNSAVYARISEEKHSHESLLKAIEWIKSVGFNGVEVYAADDSALRPLFDKDTKGNQHLAQGRHESLRLLMDVLITAIRAFGEWKVSVALPAPKNDHRFAFTRFIIGLSNFPLSYIRIIGTMCEWRNDLKGITEGIPVFVNQFKIEQQNTSVKDIERIQASFEEIHDLGHLNILPLEIGKKRKRIIASDSILYQPFNLHSLGLSNRIYMCSMYRGRGEVPGELTRVYYSQRADGGLLLSENCAVDPIGKDRPDGSGLNTEEQVKGWSAITQAVHGNNAKIFCTLSHAGRRTHPSNLPNNQKPVSCSDKYTPEILVHSKEDEVPMVQPRVLSTAEVEQTVQKYGVAAANAMKAGFDGVMILATYGHLIESFLADSVNNRTDSYGGSIEARAKFLFDVVAEAKKVWGPQRVAIKISNYPSAYVKMDMVSTLSYLIKKLNKMELAFLAVHITRDESKTACPLEYIRKLWKGPLLVEGGFTKELAEGLIQKGGADMVGFGQLYVSNPDLPNRFAHSLPLTKPDSETFFTGGADGYIDYSVVDMDLANYIVDEEEDEIEMWELPQSDNESETSSDDEVAADVKENMKWQKWREMEENAKEKREVLASRRTPSQELLPEEDSEFITAFLPSDLIETLTANPKPIMAPLVEAIDCVIMMVDISGFTALGEQLAGILEGPEILTQNVNCYFADLMDCIFDARGSVERFAGDALITVFRDADLKIAALRATHAAIQIQTNFASHTVFLRDRSIKLDETELTVHIGISSGEATTLCLGGLDGKWQRMVMGEPLVELKAVLSASAKKEIVVSKSIYAMVKESIKAEKIQIDDHGEMIDVYKVHSWATQPLKLSKPVHSLITKDMEYCMRGFIDNALLVQYDVGLISTLAELRTSTVLFISLKLQFSMRKSENRNFLPFHTAILIIQKVSVKLDGIIGNCLVDEKGCSVILLFGNPAHEDDALRGVQAGLIIKEKLGELNLQLSIGVTTGKVFFSTVGSLKRQQYTVMGSTVNMAARLMQAARCDQILCDTETHYLTQNTINYSSLPPITVKGKQGLVEIFEPTAISSTRTYIKADALALKQIVSKNLASSGRSSLGKGSVLGSQFGSSLSVAMVSHHQLMGTGEDDGEWSYSTSNDASDSLKRATSLEQFLRTGLIGRASVMNEVVSILDKVIVSEDVDVSVNQALSERMCDLYWFAGNAGYGKTILLKQTAMYALVKKLSPSRLLESSCLATDGDTAWAMWKPIFASLLLRTKATQLVMPGRARRRHIRSKLGEIFSWNPAEDVRGLVTASLPLLNEVCSTDFKMTNDIKRLSKEERLEKTCFFLSLILVHIAFGDPQPLFIFIDDVHNCVDYNSFKLMQLLATTSISSVCSVTSGHVEKLQKSRASKCSTQIIFFGAYRLEDSRLLAQKLQRGSDRESINHIIEQANEIRNEVGQHSKSFPLAAFDVSDCAKFTVRYLSELGVKQIDTTASEVLFNSSCGCPFILIELVEAIRSKTTNAVHASQLQISDGRLVLAQKISKVDISDRLMGSIKSVFDALPPVEQMILKCAAIIGETFDSETVKLIYPVTRTWETYDAELESICKYGLLVRREGPATLFAFRDAMTLEVTYRIIPSSLRGTLHFKMVEYYQRVLEKEGLKVDDYEQAVNDLWEEDTGHAINEPQAAPSTGTTKLYTDIAHHVCGSYFSNSEVMTEVWMTLYYVFKSSILLNREWSRIEYVMRARQIRMILNEMGDEANQKLVEKVKILNGARLVFSLQFVVYKKSNVSEVRDIHLDSWNQIKNDYFNPYYIYTVSVMGWVFALHAREKDVMPILDMEDEAVAAYTEKGDVGRVVVFKFLIARLRACTYYNCGEMLNCYKHSVRAFQMHMEHSDTHLHIAKVQAMSRTDVVSRVLLQDSLTHCLRSAFMLLDFKRFDEFQRLQFEQTDAADMVMHSKVFLGIAQMFCLTLAGHLEKVLAMSEQLHDNSSKFSFFLLANLAQLYRVVAIHFSKARQAQHVYQIGQRLVNTTVNSIYLLLVAFTCVDQSLPSEAEEFICLGLESDAVIFYPALHTLRATLIFLSTARVSSDEPASYIARSLFCFNVSDVREGETVESAKEFFIMSDDVRAKVEDTYLNAIRMAEEKRNAFMTIFCAYAYALYIETQLGRAAIDGKYSQPSEVARWKKDLQDCNALLKKNVSGVDTASFTCRVVQNIQCHLNGYKVPYEMEMFE